jgi:tetratricopeptide (TPR) repeat protein
MPKDSLQKRRRRNSQSAARSSRQDRSRPRTGAAPGGPGGVLPRVLPWLAAVLAVIVFAGVLGYPFVYDDTGQIVQNKQLTSWAYLPQYFTRDVWHEVGKDSHSNYYRPLFLVWLRLNYQWFGLEPAGYHTLVLALHALVTLLVYLLAARTLKDKLAAGFAALLFAVHPLHVESVAWISGANEPEFALFFLAAILCYLHWRGRRAAAGSQQATSDKLQAASQSAQRTSAQLVECSPDSKTAGPLAYKWFILSLACYALSLLSKETAVVLCPLVFLYEWRWEGGESQATSNKRQATSQKAGSASLQLEAWSLKLKRACLVTLPYALLTLMYLAARARALRGLAPEVYTKASRAAIVMTFPAAFWFYLRKLVWPLPMSVFYSFRVIAHAGLANFVWPVVAALAALAGLWIWSRRNQAAGVAAAWLLLPLAPPVLALANFRPVDLVHDRYLYLPSVGLVILAALALRKLAPGGRKFLGAPVWQLLLVLLLVCLLGGWTIQQSRQWSSDLALYRHGTEVAPDNPLVLTLYSIFLQREQHDPQAALVYAERALAQQPDDYTAIVNTGIFRRNVHDDDGALALWLRARQLYPERREAYLWMGVLYSDRGQLNEAEAAFRKAISLAPQEPDQHFMLGGVLQRQNRLAEAREQYQLELQVHPGATRVRQRLAALDSQMSQRE